MLTLRVIVVGRTREAFVREGEALYRRRIERFARLQWIEVKPAAAAATPEAALRQEASALARQVGGRDYLIALDRLGKQWDSRRMAAHIARLSMTHPRLCFLIGGPEGIARDLLERCQERMSLSRLTFTHEMSRVILLEQLYRALSINQGTAYHR